MKTNRIECVKTFEKLFIFPKIKPRRRTIIEKSACITNTALERREK